jgi:hypothetical protein
MKEIPAGVMFEAFVASIMPPKDGSRAAYRRD